MAERKTYMFQFATDYDDWQRGTKIHEDTKRITKTEAVALFNKYKPQFIREIKNGDRPQICIWKDCRSDDNYASIFINIDNSCEVIGNEIYIIDKKLVRL